MGKVPTTAGIQWREVLRRQDYANLLLTACIVGALIAVSVAATPRVRPYFIYDATISYLYHGDTIPAWAAVLVPLLMLIITVLVGELVYNRRQHASRTDALATAVYFILDGVQSFICGLLLAQVFKVVTGQLRPNFLDRCDPGGGGASGNTWTTLLWGQDDPQAAYPCTNMDHGTINDGRKSFPSGHASTCSNLAVYASAYLIWCFHVRKPRMPMHLPFWQEFKEDLKNVCAKVWMLGMLSYAWGVSVSRIFDGQHAPADVLGGLLLGTMIALVYVLRAIPHYRRVLSPETPVNGGPTNDGLPMQVVVDGGSNGVRPATTSTAETAFLTHAR